MPLFFIASGFFFSDTCLGNKKKYINRKIRGIYIPYFKWSIIFLFLHNVFFYCGILNPSYGYFSGVCSHLYSLKEILYRLMNIAFRMTEYESFLLGAYWFMRSLFVGCLLLCFCSWLIDKTLKSRQTSIAFVSIFFCLIGGMMAYYNIHLPHFPQGGYREVMAVFFIGCGYFLAQIQNKIRKGAIVLASLGVLIVLVSYHPTSMSPSADFGDWIVIPFTGVSGFIIIYYVSSKLSISNSFISNSLKYLGTKTFYILTFHFLMFKPASLLNAYIYNLDWRVIGCHPVVLPIRDNWFWIVYTIISICLSLFVVWALEMIGKCRKANII